MGKYFKYKDGDAINGFTLVKRLDKRGANWYGLFICPYCGKEFEAQIGHIKKGGVKSCGCQRLYGLGSPNYPNEKRNTRDLTNQRFGKLTALYPIGQKKEYSNRSMYWHCRCDCGTEKDVSSESLTRGHVYSCGCLQSRGEFIIRTILNDLQIGYETQKVFSSCINPKTGAYYRFDFYIPDKDLLIEYDGEQHFGIKINENFWATEEHYKTLKYNDEQKNKWCRKNHYSLIRIPYLDLDKINKKYMVDVIEGRMPTNANCKMLFYSQQ